MSPSRDQILGSIRRALRRGALAPEAVAACETRLVTHPRNLIPARARTLPPRGQVELFVKMAEAANATVARVREPREVPATIAAYLARLNLPQRLVRAPDPALDALPWSAQTLLETRRGIAADSDPVGVTTCFAAIAETGTLMLHSGPAGPTRNNFLPDTHIAVVRASQVVAAYEDGWDRLRAAPRDADARFAMPRTVNFVTGPSRTADIEQKIELGAHGPRRLHIVLIDDGATT
ncbi:MAG: lactate utilization protein [Alphaproteobacteria bacterium]|nr:lactate utilization protein [Alphaproteobacteria bacterium]